MALRAKIGQQLGQYAWSGPWKREGEDVASPLFDTMGEAMQWYHDNVRYHGELQLWHWTHDQWQYVSHTSHYLSWLGSRCDA